MNKKSELFIPSIADIIFLSLFLYLSLSAGKGLLGDCDTGYHIRAGEFMLDTLSVPRHDIFSFLTPPIPWTAHEWLSELIMALVHRAFGLTGTVLFFSFLISLTYYLFFRIIRADKSNILLAILIMVLAIASSQIHWLARPHIFSLLLMVVWYYLLDAFQYKGENRLWLCPLLMIIWVNLHGGFITGFILLGIYFTGNLVLSIMDGTKMTGEYRSKYRAIALITLLCLAAALINPLGYHILLFPFNLVDNKFLMDHVQEFISPNFHEPLPFKYFLFLMLAILAVSRERLNFVELALILFFTNMALYSARYIPLFAIVATPVMLRKAGRIVDESSGWFIDFLKRKGDAIASIDSTAKGYLWLVAGVLAVVFWTADGRLEYKFDPKIKPVAAVEFLKREPIKGNMFDNDEFGDYIIYAASPQYKVFFDGRSDMYGTDRMKEYFKIANFDNGWEEILNKYKIDWIIYDANSGLSRFLLKNEEWRLVYADKVANIFVKNIPEYQYLINKYRGVKPVPTTDNDKAGT